MPQTKDADVHLIRRLLNQVRPYWGHLIAIFLLDLLATPLALLNPVPLKIAVDNVLNARPVPDWLDRLLPAWIRTSPAALLGLAVGLILAVALFRHLQTLASSLLHAATGERMALDFRAQLLRHVQRLSLTYHDTRGTADSTYRVLWDSSAVRYVAVDSVPPFVSSVVTVASMLYVTLRLDWQLAVIAMAVSPLLFMLTRAYRARLRDHSREVKVLESAALSIVHEVLGALRVVKAFGQEDREQERFELSSRQGMKARLKYILDQEVLGLLLGLAVGGGTAAVLYIGVVHIRAGTLTLGGLLLVMSYISQLYVPLQTMSRKVAGLQSHMASAERAYSLLDEAPDIPERPDARPLERAGGSISFDHVSFRYGGTSQEILSDISFEAPAGTRAGIIGTTGSGKTTLISLLVRFYEPTTGTISLDGVDLRDYRPADLRNQFSVVLQEPVLFSTSIGENISYARPGAAGWEIVEAAKAANIHEFITGLPDGYDTRVGERGARLSGGERQRIALARAFLKNAPILILDEPTSSVDRRTEAGIMESIERLMQGRTAFLIAHRLSTLQQCNLLLVIEGGRLVGLRSDVASAIREALSAGDLPPRFLRQGE